MRRLAFHVADGLELAADAHGDPSGRPVLLLHGGGQTRHAWGGTAAALAERGFHAVALDLRGHGESGPTATTRWMPSPPTCAPSPHASVGAPR